MASIIPTNNFNEFIRNNSFILKEENVQYWYLRIAVKKVRNGEIQALDGYNITDEDGSFVMCLVMPGNYYLMSDKWNESIIDLLLEKINQDEFRNYHFLGSRELLIRLFEKGNIRFKVFKDRLFYQCNKVLPLKKQLIGFTQMGLARDLIEIAGMAYDFYLEEYNGQGLKTKQEAFVNIAASIEKGDVFLVRDQRNIFSILILINDENEQPFIGSLFTKKIFRNKGCAYSLLYTVTKGLLEDGATRCALVSDALNISSNKTFQNVGYVPIYKWIDIIHL